MKRTLASTLLLALLWSVLCSVPEPAQAKTANPSLVSTASGSDRVMRSSVTVSTKLPANEFDAPLVRTASGRDRVLHSSVTVSTKLPANEFDAPLVRTASGSDRVLHSSVTVSTKLPANEFDAPLVRTASGSDRVMHSSSTASLIKASASDFDTVVKVVEEFYNVKHRSLPFIAKAGIKTARAAAHLAGGTKRRIAEAGSVKLAFFEDQEFGAKGGVTNFRTALKAVLVGKWLPFVQVLSLNDGTQTYIFLRDAGPKYTVMVVTIEEHDAVVVQVDLAPQTLAMLMQDPNEMGKAITDDATKTDDQE